MSVSHDCLAGDVIYVIEGFVANLKYDGNENLDITNSLELEVGDIVKYVEWYDEIVGNNVLKKIKYKHLVTGEVLSAAESYFVTEDVWNGLIEYFNRPSESIGAK